MTIQTSKSKMSGDQFELFHVFVPRRMYLIDRLPRQSLPQVYEVRHPDEVTSMYGRFHSLVCGDVGFASTGHKILWWVQTSGPLVDYVRQESRNSAAVILVGFVVLEQSGDVKIANRQCTVQYTVNLMCVTPAYRKQQHGRQLWRATEQFMVLDTYMWLTNNPPLRRMCDRIERIRVVLEAEVTYRDAGAMLAWVTEHPTQELAGLEQFASGGWKFWHSVGFEFMRLQMGAALMQKYIAVPAALRVEGPSARRRSQPVRRSARRRAAPY